MNFDFVVLDWIQAHLTSSFMDILMPLVTVLGNAGAIWIAAAAVLLLWKKHRRDGVTLTLALVLDLLLCNVLLKNLFSRPRPFVLNPAVTLLIRQPSGYSFPSGHTAVSFAAATVLWSIDRRWGGFAYLLAALIGFSRLYLYVHFPTDVLAGMLVGVAAGAAAVFLTRTRSKDAPQR